MSLNQGWGTTPRYDLVCTYVMKNCTRLSNLVHRYVNYIERGYGDPRTTDASGLCRDEDAERNTVKPDDANPGSETPVEADTDDTGAFDCHGVARA